MADQIITDIPLIRRYARHNEDADWRFRSYLKGSNKPDTEIDQTVQAITDEVWKDIDCTTCANCCKTLQIVVDDNDILQLSKSILIKPSQFVKLYVETDGDGTKLLKSQPCVFLGQDKKCTVYENRPKACRDFPYLHRPRFRNRSITMVSNLGICPIVFNVWQRLKDVYWGENSRRRKRL
jgi:uncharacterized protein